VSSDFSDPEGLFDLARHLSHLQCYPAMANDEWLDPLCKKREFKSLLETARERPHRAVETFNQRNGKTLLS